MTRGGRRYVVEQLEVRTLLAGVTLIAHGYQGDADFPPWVPTMAGAIVNRVGGADIYKLRIIESNGIPVFDSFKLQATGSSNNAEHIIELDWSDVSNDIFTIGADDVAALVAPRLRMVQPFTGFPATPFAELPIHLVGHSRGGALVADLARLLGQYGIWVQHVTTLDPHPVVPLDPGPSESATLYDNIVLADNWYEDTFIINGGPVAGAHNVGPLSLVGGSINDHTDVHVYYHGTIDRDAVNNGANDDIEDFWYGGNRSIEGFDKSRIGRGDPWADGLSNLGGGSAARSHVELKTVNYWSNIGSLTIAGDVNGIINTGALVSLGYRYQDIDGGATVSFYVDADGNPYNSNHVALASEVVPFSGPLPNAAMRAINNVSWPSLPDGRYRVFAKITNPDGFTRYAEMPHFLLDKSAGAKLITKEWTGDVPANPEWSDGRNWTPGGVPTFADRTLVQNVTLSLSSGQAEGDIELLASTLNWSGGSIEDTLLNTGAVRVLGASPVELEGVLTNAGTLVHQGTSNVVFSTGRLENLSGATVDLQSTGGLAEQFSTAVINNAGTIRKTGSGAATVSVTLNNNGGTVQAEFGSLSLTGGGVGSNATYSASSGTTLGFDPGSLETFSFVGTNNVAGGSGLIRISGQGTVGGGSGLLTLTGSSTWTSGGTIGGTAGVRNNGAMSVTGSSSVELEGVLTNAGTLVHQGTSNVVFSTGRLENLSGATVDLQSTGGLAEQFSTAVINNAGTIRKTGSGAATVSVTLNNNGGTMELLAGTLVLNADYVQSSAGTLSVRIAGSNGATSATMTGSGSLNLAGRFLLQQDASFTPLPYVPFTVLTYASRTGTFNQIQGFSYSPGLMLFVSVGASATTLQPVLPGDANRDRTVNLADFNVLAGNFGQSNRTFSQGDFNYDGVVNLADFNILAGRFGMSAASSFAVPERIAQTTLELSGVLVEERANEAAAWEAIR